MKSALFVFLLLYSANLPAQQLEGDCSGDAGFKNKGELTKFTENLRSANSADSLSLFISFPLRINEGPNKHFSIRNESELKTRFKEAFPEEVLKAIRVQDPKATFCNYQGLTIGGVVWINKKNGKTGISVVNLHSK